MNKFTKNNLKPNMILRFENNKGIYSDGYYSGVPIVPDYIGGFFDLSDFDDNLNKKDNNLQLVAVFIPDYNHPFDPNQYEEIWNKDDEINSIEFEYKSLSNSVILFQPNGDKYYEEDFGEFDRIMHITISNKMGNCSDISLTYNQMKDLKNNLDKIIKYIENKSLLLL